MIPVACIVLARPTKHIGLYRQMVGRVLRPAPGKDHALVLDHAGNVFQHGFVEVIAPELRIPAGGQGAAVRGPRSGRKKPSNRARKSTCPRA